MNDNLSRSEPVLYCMYISIMHIYYLGVIRTKIIIALSFSVLSSIQYT